MRRCLANDDDDDDDDCSCCYFGERLFSLMYITALLRLINSCIYSFFLVSLFIFLATHIESQKGCIALMDYFFFFLIIQYIERSIAFIFPRHIS